MQFLLRLVAKCHFQDVESRQPRASAFEENHLTDFKFKYSYQKIIAKVAVAVFVVAVSSVSYIHQSFY